MRGTDGNQTSKYVTYVVRVLKLEIEHAFFTSLDNVEEYKARKEIAFLRSRQLFAHKLPVLQFNVYSFSFFFVFFFNHGYTNIWASQVALVWKNSPANAGDIRDVGMIPGLGRSPGGGHGNPLQYSCLENPTDRGAWSATVHRVAKRQTRLKRLSMHTPVQTNTHIFVVEKGSYCTYCASTFPLLN